MSACGSEGLSSDAGEDFTVEVGATPDFDGCGSSGEIVNYAWSIADTPAGRTDDAGKVLREVSTDCAFTLESAMVVDEVGVWTIELAVTDADGASDVDQVEVSVVE